MNRQEYDILLSLQKENFVNQRILAEQTGYSLGIVNRTIKILLEDGYLNEQMNLTEKALKELKEKDPKNAIILAAGFGMRMVPVNLECPKALVEVNGETLIERLIKQLQQVGVRRIFVVVGFMKERFEYLIDEYGVELIINEEYYKKNNLHSLFLASEHLCNTYIVPCDIWCAKNPFHAHELYSWYMVSDIVDNESNVRVNRKRELVTISNEHGGNAMIGISYLLDKECQIVREKLKICDSDSRFDNSFWEETLYDNERMIVQAKVVHASKVVEIDTYEQLRELDEESNQLKSDAISIIAENLHVDSTEIVDITVLKKGMTNRSFLFSCNDKKYIMRIPGEGTDQLINRYEETAVYEVIRDRSICDEIIYINPVNGYKITSFLEGARVCNPDNVNDLKICMKKLKEFHELKLQVEHEFNILAQIDFYESLWEGKESVYKDYKKTKSHVLSLETYVKKHSMEKCLVHIDAVPDNFLFVSDGISEEVKLIDWEYAGMQDPHVDIAMFCIYSLYNREQVDQLIDIYFENKCEDRIRIKIYCYIAMCGLLWSNWCEYKRNLGVEFGEYALRQYRYAKEYYKIVLEELAEKNE